VAAATSPEPDRVPVHIVGPAESAGKSLEECDRLVAAAGHLPTLLHHSEERKQACLRLCFR
jgi:hypothetical protein